MKKRFRTWPADKLGYFNLSAFPLVSITDSGFKSFWLVQNPSFLSYFYKYPKRLQLILEDMACIPRFKAVIIWTILNPPAAENILTKLNAQKIPTTLMAGKKREIIISQLFLIHCTFWGEIIYLIKKSIIN